MWPGVGGSPGALVHVLLDWNYQHLLLVVVRPASSVIAAREVEMQISYYRSIEESCQAAGAQVKVSLSKALIRLRV